jgi:hypothetical protein
VGRLTEPRAGQLQPGAATVRHERGAKRFVADQAATRHRRSSSPLASAVSAAARSHWPFLIVLGDPRPLVSPILFSLSSKTPAFYSRPERRTLHYAESLQILFYGLGLAILAAFRLRC